MYTPRSRAITPQVASARYNSPKPKRESYVDFSENSTTHGVYYAFERDVKSVSHVFWVLICLGLCTLAIYFITVQFIEWRKNPVLTTVSTTGYPVSKLDFPAVTLCSLGLVNTIMDNAYLYYLEEYADEKGVDVSGDEFDGDTDAILDKLLDEGHDFNEDHFPGATIDPRSLIRAMASRNPDEFIRSEVSIFGFDECD